MDIPILSKKAQFNLGFIVGVLLLTSIIIYFVIYIGGVLPDYKQEAEKNALHTRAQDLFDMIFYDPGIPANSAVWKDPGCTRCGVGFVEPVSNRSVYGVIDEYKLLGLSTLQSVIHSNFSITQNVFRFRVENETDVLKEWPSNFNATPLSHDAVAIKRVMLLERSDGDFMIDNLTLVNVTLWMW
jgi:hypothetical protein